MEARHDTIEQETVVEEVLNTIELEAATEEALSEVEGAEEFMKRLDEEQIDKLIAPENESNPQLSWPEGNLDGTVSEHDYVFRLNYRLTVAGFTLDAARPHLESIVDTAEWLLLKGALSDAKSNEDMYSKVDAVIALEEDVSEFALRHGTTQAEYDAARNS
jgi:hypothetical protein